MLILRDSGAVSRVGRKSETKVYKYGRKNPWVPTLTELFPKTTALPHTKEAIKKLILPETLNILLTDKILEAMDKKQITALVLLDLSKAFDSIDHVRLLHKLSILGASPSIIKWFKSYLTVRRQYVRIGSATLTLYL